MRSSFSTTAAWWRSAATRSSSRAATSMPISSPASSRWGQVLWQQIADDDGGRRGRERRDALVRPEGDRAAVTPAEGRGRVRHRLAVDLDAPVWDGHDPGVGDAGPSVETPRLLTVEAQTGYRHLDDQDRTLWMRIAIVTRIAGRSEERRVGKECRS